MGQACTIFKQLSTQYRRLIIPLGYEQFCKPGAILPTNSVKVNLVAFTEKYHLTTYFRNVILFIC